MNENLSNIGSSPDRRSQGRVHVQSGPQSVTYAELGGGQFGIITDISEGGFAMQTIGGVTGDDFPSVCFRLSPFGNPIRPTTQVVWKSASKKTVGVRFLALSAAEKTELRGWVFTHLTMESNSPSQSSPAAPERPAQHDSDPFGHLQQVLAESSRRPFHWRKWAQWGLTAVLGFVLVSCLIALWRITPRTSLGNVSALPSRGAAAIRSIRGYARAWARGAFHFEDSEDRSSNVVHSPVPVKPKAGSKGIAPNDSRTAADLFRKPDDVSKVPSLSDDATPGPVGCRNLVDSAAAVNIDSVENGGDAADTAVDTRADATFAKPVLTIGPAYPITDAQSCIDGAVRLRATIDRNGAVSNLEPISGPATLFEAAMSAARYWRFRPVVSQGQTIESDRDIQVVFRNMLADTQ